MWLIKSPRLDTEFSIVLHWFSFSLGRTLYISIVPLSCICISFFRSNLDKYSFDTIIKIIKDEKLQSAFYQLCKTAFFYWFSPLAMQVAACICCPKGALWFGECLWEVVRVETFVRVLRSSRVNLTKRKWYKRVLLCLDQKPFILFSL